MQVFEMVIFAKQATQIYTLFNSLDKANMNSHNIQEL